MKLHRLFYFHKIRFRGFLKNRRNGNFAEGTEANLSLSGTGKKIDDYGENDEYKNRKKHIYKENREDSIYCPLLFQRRGKGNHAGKD